MEQPQPEPTRAQFRKQVNQHQGWQELNQLLRERQQLENKCAELYQTMSKYRRRIGKLDEQYSQLVLKAEPSVVERDDKQPKTTKPSESSLSAKIKQAAKTNPELARKLQDLVDGL